MLAYIVYYYFINYSIFHIEIEYTLLYGIMLYTLLTIPRGGSGGGTNSNNGYSSKTESFQRITESKSEE